MIWGYFSHAHPVSAQYKIGYISKAIGEKVEFFSLSPGEAKPRMDLVDKFARDYVAWFK